MKFFAVFYVIHSTIHPPSASMKDELGPAAQISRFSSSFLGEQHRNLNLFSLFVG
jgi:hypothetical protein